MTAVKKIERVLITAGGTGGHVFPALAAARLFQEYGVEVCWVGTRQAVAFTPNNDDFGIHLRLECRMH